MLVHRLANPIDAFPFTHSTREADNIAAVLPGTSHAPFH